MHICPDHTPTVALDWGTLKWLVNPSDVEGADTTVGEVIVFPGRGHAVHRHPNAQEVIYVIEGEGVQTVGDGEPFAIKAGDAVFIPKDVDHSTFNTSWRSLRLIVTYSPGGEERNFLQLPDYQEFPAGQTPTWARDGLATS